MGAELSLNNLQPSLRDSIVHFGEIGFLSLCYADRYHVNRAVR